MGTGHRGRVMDLKAVGLGMGCPGLELSGGCFGLLRYSVTYSQWGTWVRVWV